MAYAKKCDRCGTHYSYNQGVKFEQYGHDDWYHEIDLCRDCASEFKEFMRGTKPKNLLDRLKRIVVKED